ncbi:MAG: hypothetical protein WA814_02385 [Candidatus Baltobacteraceae bacterium]
MNRLWPVALALTLLGVACVAVVAPSRAVTADPAETPPVLPSGTYRYAVHSDGKTTATSTVTIAHDAMSVTVTETVDLQGETYRTTRRLDPATFSTISWSGPDDAVTIGSKSATYRSTKTTTTLAAPVDGPAAVFDFLVAEFSTMPAMLHATGARQYNEYCVCIGGFQAKAISVVTATAPRPATVQPSDVAIALNAEGETATLWYDPQMFVLRELDFPRDRISYVRI